MQSQWKRGETRNSMRNRRDVMVPAHIYRNVLACHRDGTGRAWAVTHTASGLSVSPTLTLKTLKRAKEYAERCHGLLPQDEWIKERPNMGGEDRVEATRRLLEEFRR
jgi:hypothetical protein